MWIASTNTYFEVSQNRKVAKKISRNNWDGLLAEPTFSQKGRQKYSMKILGFSGNMMIGVALKSTYLYSGAYSQGSSWMLSSAGYIYYQGSYRSYLDMGRIGSFLAGDIITVQVDMDTKVLSFRVNSLTLGPAIRMSISYSDLQNLAPAVDIYYAGDSVALL